MGATFDGKGARKIKDERGRNVWKWSKSHLPFLISHRTPLLRSKHTLVSRLLFVAEDVLDECGVRANVLKEHKVSAERLLRRVGVLEVCFSRLARLALRRPKHILAFYVIGRQGPLPLGELAFALFLRSLRSAFKWLEEDKIGS